MSARFMELLGDFVEPKQARRPLPPHEQTALMESCVRAIQSIRKDRERVILTSDSVKFVEYAAAHLHGVEYIPGSVCHISVEAHHRDDADLKTFADFYAIARARESYLLLGPGMYRSNFSRRAAQSAPHPFHVVTVY